MEKRWFGGVDGDTQASTTGASRRTVEYRRHKKVERSTVGSIPTRITFGTRSLEAENAALSRRNLGTKPGRYDAELRRAGCRAEKGDLKGNRSMNIEQKLLADLDLAEEKAWDSLSRYKFQMFGYWAAIWVHLNRIGGFKRPSPFASVVRIAKSHQHAVKKLEAA